MQKNNNPLYCIAKPSTVWNGLAALPAGWTPTCPVSRSYRQEIRQGSSRVEQYRLGGWQPLAARDLLGQAGYALVEDELHMPTHYSAFLGRVTPAELYLTAVQDGPDTLVTISGAQASSQEDVQSSRERNDIRAANTARIRYDMVEKERRLSDLSAQFLRQ